MRSALTSLLIAISLPLFGDITVSTITPSAGLIAGGTIVHIHGTNLLGAPLACASVQCSVYVQFGDTLGTVIFDSADEIVVAAPAHAAGPVDLVVNVPVSAPLTLKNAFTYQDPADTNVRVLLPIAGGAQGILNTSWQTFVFAHNETMSPLDIGATTVPPLESRQLLALKSTSIGMFLDIPRSVVDGVTITTYIHDTVHDRENLGVDIPGVPETQFRRAVVLTGVPANPFYRGLLRVYGYPGSHQVVVRERDEATNRLLSTQTLPLGGSDVAYLQVPIDYFPNLRRIEVTTASPTDPPIWAFMTFTNNTTETVTAIMPNIAVAPAAPSTALSAGHWAHAGNCASVTADGSLSVTYGGCHFGTVRVLSVDPDGHFEADGSLSRGGACCLVRENAHFAGVVVNGTLTLWIRTVTETIDPFTLVYGSTDPCTPPCP